jgi:hypothetical protein
VIACRRAVLAGLAAVIIRIRLATLCAAISYRNPAHLAKIAATSDPISRTIDATLRLPVGSTLATSLTADIAEAA